MFARHTFLFFSMPRVTAQVAPLLIACAAWPATLPPGRTLSGGIGSEGQQEMRADRSHYNLHMTFAETSGAYVAGVFVTIRRIGGEGSFGPFADSGPFFFIALSPGTYIVNATYNGTPRTRTIIIGSGATDATLYWPATSPGREPLDP